MKIMWACFTIVMFAAGMISQIMERYDKATFFIALAIYGQNMVLHG